MKNPFSPRPLAIPSLSLIALFSALLFPASATDSEGIEGVPLKPRPTGEGTLFELLPPERTGIHHTNPIDADHPLRRVYHSSSACGGLAIGDLDLDGTLDIFAGNGPDANSLYLGKKDDPFAFVEVAEKLGVAGEKLTWATGVALVDSDNDGDLDIFVCNYDHPNQLFINGLIKNGERSDEGLHFTEEASAFGLDLVDGSVMPAFADFDRDGDLDLYVLCHQIYRENGRPAEPIEILTVDGKLVPGKAMDRYYEVKRDRGENGEIQYTESGRPDRFYRNDGANGFTDITAEAGISTEKHWGNSATWWDYNHDGWPDLYVGNDFKSPDFVYRNNGDGTFTEVSKTLLRHSTWFSMGAVQADLNNNGLTDFVLADMLPSDHYMQKASMGSMGSGFEDLKYVDGARQLMRNAVYYNTGTDRFLEGAWLTGMATTEWTWGIRAADFDSDRRVDVFFTNGIPRQFNHSDLPDIGHKELVGKTHWDHYQHTPERREPNRMFRNLGDFQFEKTEKQWGVDHLGMSYGASHADFDGDGHLELLVSNLQDPISFYRNRGTGNNRVVFDFVGSRSNRFGIGCQVTLTTSAGTQVRQLFPTGGFLDGDDTILHFGLGDLEKINSAKIDWPSGAVQIFKDLDANHRYTVTEPSDRKVEPRPAIESREPENPWFTEVFSLRGFSHKETPFDDFARQPLLPRKLSQLGPGQAWSDLDNDGDPDLFLGGAAGQAARLFRNITKPGSDEVQLAPFPVAALETDAAHEDMGALFFDVNGDGFDDLYVVSGGNECEPGDPVLQDRLYFNDGNGDFVRAEDALPDLRNSGSAVAAADYDRDGDLDIFVGSRMVPGQYPVVPESALLRNRGDGTFENVAEEISSGLPRVGLVTGALWSDANGDGWQDLLVSCDWGPVKLFLNRNGTLELQSDEYTGFATTTGWFNGIEGADIDGDGDIDYVATNFGNNTQYQPSLDKPTLVFYGDFEGKGKANIVEAIFEEVNGKKICFPFRGLSCSSRAMPFVREKMQTYHNFAKANLTEIYSPNLLQQSLMHKVTTLESILMRNDGKGKFEVTPLPQLAQFSPGFGIVMADYNLDGWIDCFLAQNFFTPQEEVGAMDCGLSLIMRGTGKPDSPFDPVWPRESGIEIPGDAMSASGIDVNLDGLPDLVTTQNDDDVKIYLNRPLNDKTHPIRIRLKGSPGNVRGVGAKVTVETANLPPQTREIRAGSGYLTQQGSDLIFAVPVNTKDDISVKIRWPDGLTSSTLVAPKSQFIEVAR